jgi:hypothetical protein
MIKRLGAEDGEGFQPNMESDVVRERLSEIFDSIDPLRTIRTFIKEGDFKDLSATEALRLKIQMSGDDKNKSEEARMLLTWYCLPTMSRVLEEFEPIIQDPRELLSISLPIALEHINKWTPPELRTDGTQGADLKAYLNMRLRYSMRVGIIEELDLEMGQYQTVAQYAQAFREFTVLHHRDSSGSSQDVSEIVGIMRDFGYVSPEPGVEDPVIKRINARFNAVGLDSQIPDDSQDSNPPVAFALKERKTTLDTAVSKINDPEIRQVVKLRFGEDMTLEESAIEMGIAHYQSVGRLNQKAMRILIKNKNLSLYYDDD